MGTAIKHPVPDRGNRSLVIFYILALWRTRLSVKVSKNTNDGLTMSDTGCFIAVPISQQWAWKGENSPLSQIWYAALYRECLAGAQIIFSESGRGLGHVTPTIFGIRLNISLKLLELETSNLIHGFVWAMPSKRTNKFPWKWAWLRSCDH